MRKFIISGVLAISRLGLANLALGAPMPAKQILFEKKLDEQHKLVGTRVEARAIDSAGKDAGPTAVYSLEILDLSTNHGAVLWREAQLVDFLAPIEFLDAAMSERAWVVVTVSRGCTELRAGIIPTPQQLAPAPWPGPLTKPATLKIPNPREDRSTVSLRLEATAAHAVPIGRGDSFIVRLGDADSLRSAYLCLIDITAARADISWWRPVERDNRDP